MTGQWSAPPKISAVSFITQNGLVSGQSLNGSIDPLTGWPEMNAVLWTHGQVVNLGTLGGYESGAGQVNTRGQVTGISSNTVPDPYSFLGFVTQTRAFIWQDGLMQDLGTLGGPDAFAPYINEKGQISGLSYTNSTPNPVTGLPTTDPFLWEDGKMTDLGTLGGTFGGAGWMNNRGQVIGASNLAGDLISHPFLWPGTNGGMQDLGTLGGDCGGATVINDAGAVIGLADISGAACGQQGHAFLWTSTAGMQDLGTVDGDCFSGAFGINASNQVVGQSISCDGSTAHALLWENGGIIDLNVFVPTGSGVTLDDVETINDHGEMFGAATLADGNNRAFVLVPCDENHLGVEGCDYKCGGSIRAATRASCRARSHARRTRRVVAA
jgi:probable HAF family extracellular repeat protein